MANTNGESWCMGLDGLDQRCAAYYKAGARFAKWRSVVSIAAGPSNIALRDCAYGLARYAAIAQNAGLVPIVEPEVRDRGCGQEGGFDKRGESMRSLALLSASRS